MDKEATAIGIDVGKHKLDVALIIEGKVRSKSVANSSAGYVGDMQRFDSAKALAAHLGVSPRQRTSGTSIRGRTSMCRTGNRTTRSALYMPAVVASRHNPVLKNFAERLHANGLPKKAVIGAVMRKLVHLMFAVVRSGIAFQPDYPRSLQMS